ncbi:MAG: hypothetical protein ABSF51_14425 [Verrucomicrobiota bacterium]|jgi:hypothetical protein
MKRFFFRICLAALFLLALLLVCFIVWRVNLARDVNAKLAAIRAAGLPTSGVELNAYYSAVPDNENAALVMTQAFALIRSYSDSRSNEVDQFQFPERGQPVTPEESKLLYSYVEMNSDALARIREAIKLPESRYPVDYTPGLITLLPHLTQLNKLEKIAEYELMLASQSGDTTNAVVAIESLVGIAHSLDEEPDIIAQLVHVRFILSVENSLEYYLNATNLNATQLGELAALIANAERTNLMARALIGDRAELIPYFQLKPVWLRNDNENKWVSDYPPTKYWFMGVGERDLIYYLRVMDTNIAFANLPFPRNLDAINNFVGEATDKIEQHPYTSFHYEHPFLLSATFLPSTGIILKREAEFATKLHLTVTALAIERFRSAHGRLPENLNELVPQFLSGLPVDPFDGQPLRYHRLAKGYVIYSVGADGHDDGGREKPADWKSTDKTTYDITFTVER